MASPWLRTHLVSLQKCNPAELDIEAVKRTTNHGYKVSDVASDWTSYPRTCRRVPSIGIVDLDYVGIPLSISYADYGYKVIGFDINQLKGICIAGITRILFTHNPVFY